MKCTCNTNDSTNIPLGFSIKIRNIRGSAGIMNMQMVLKKLISLLVKKCDGVMDKRKQHLIICVLLCDSPREIQA